jgi:hypothetical protein
MKGFRFFAFAAVVCAAAAVPLAQVRPDATNTIHSSLLAQLYYRPLTLFSRGGRVTAVTGVPSKPAEFYMGAAGGGVWRTTNSGERWEPLTDGQIGVGTIGAIDVSPLRSRRHLCRHRISRPARNVTNSDGVYKSIDAARRGRTSASRRPASSAGSASTRPTPTSPSPCSAMSSDRISSAVCS